jgi:RNA polymerase-binding transcription factor
MERSRRRPRSARRPTFADRLEAQRRAAALELPGRRLCTDCDGEIPAARRRALPSAIRCVECQEWHEHVEKVTA